MRSRFDPNAPRGTRRRARRSYGWRSFSVFARGAALVWLLLGGALGCGGSSEPEPANPSSARRPSTGDGEPSAPHEESPGIADMPYLPLRLASTSPRFQRVYRLALVASESPLEPLPERASRADVDAWAEGVLVPWIELRSDLLASCRIELRALRAGERDEHLIAAALLGYLYEDTARQLHGVRIPVPSNPRADVRAAPPERIEFLLEQARRAFERCLLAGLGALEVASYRQYCEDSIARLGPSSAEHVDDPARDDELDD